MKTSLSLFKYRISHVRPSVTFVCLNILFATGLGLKLTVDHRFIELNVFDWNQYVERLP